MEELIFLGFSKAQWDLINSFSNWLSAISTLAAVFLSLWLANRSIRLKCNVSVGHRLVIEAGNKGSPPEIIVFRIVNTCEKPVRITCIGWRVGLFRWRREAIQMFERSESSALPIELTHGQEAAWVVRLLPDEKGWIKRFPRKMLLPHPRFQVATLRALFITSVGKTFTAKPEAGLLRRLLESAASAKNDPSQETPDS